MKDITGLSLSGKAEIAEYIKRDNLEKVNRNLAEVHVKNSFYTRYGKRMADIILSLSALIVCFPVNAVIAVITFFDVGMPVIFRQTRMGKNQKSFTIYKFRNMTNEKDVNGELLPPAERITKWGRFVRKTSLDELLNFVSVLNGSMSIIGPRPLLDYYAPRLNKRHKMIYAVRPGLECPPAKKNVYYLAWEERLDNYVWYVENCSLWIDIKLFFKIIRMAVDKKSAGQRAAADYGGLLGYGEDGKVIYTKAVPDKYVEEFCRKHGYLNLEEAIADRRGMYRDREEKSVEAV